MDNENYENTIRCLASKPIRNIWINPLMVRVEYQDGQVLSEKFDLATRAFLVTLENVQFQRVAPREDCIPEKLGKFQFLGWQVGDSVVFQREDVSLPILFS